MITCPNCRYELPDVADFCTNCGMDTPQGKSSPPAAVQIQGPAPLLEAPARSICSICAESQTGEAIQIENGKPVCVNCLSRAAVSRLTRGSAKKEREAYFRNTVGTQGEHRRESTRFEVQRAVARILRKGLLSVLTLKKQAYTAPVLDLSLSGMQCLVEADLLPLDKISVQLTIPAYNTPLAINGVIRWVYPDGSRNRIGVQFVDLSAQARKHLEGLEQYEPLRRFGDKPL